MQPVIILMQALARSITQFQLPQLAIGADLETVTGFDACQDTDEPLGNAIRSGDVQRKLLLANLAAVEIDDRSPGILGNACRLLLDLFGERHAPVFEVL